MGKTFRIEWSPDHPSNRIVQFAWPCEEDLGYASGSYELDLTGEVLDWCWQTECEVPELVIANWITQEGQKYPGTVELIFKDDALAQLFKLKWQQPGTVFE